jgi:hypothetical protein
MKSILAILVIPLLVLTISCGSAPSTAGSASEQNISFMTSSYQFVKNTYTGETNPSYLVIRSYPAFDSLFGVGAVMGMDNSKLITEEKMKNGFVLSIIYQGNSIHKFDIEKIILKQNQLQVHYTSKVTEPNASWTCNCHVTALVDNCKFDSILFYENGKPLPDAVIKQL